MQYEPRSILVVDVSPFGRSLLMLPAVRALRDTFPLSLIAIAAARGSCELITAAGLADETIDLGIIRGSESSFGGALKRLLQLMRKRRSDEYDLVLDFSPGLETQLASFLNWRGRRVTPSKITQVLDLFFQSRGSMADDHAAECLRVVKKVGVSEVENHFIIPVTNDESQRFEKRLAENRPGEAAPVVVFYSSQPGEPDGWGAEKFADLAWRMKNNFAARNVFIDEPADARFTGSMKPFLPPKTLLIQSPRAMELAAALERASLVITDERGIAKVAIDAGAPVVEIADSASPYAQTESYQVVRSSSRARVEADAVFDAACVLIQSSRTSSLIGR